MLCYPICLKNYKTYMYLNGTILYSNELFFFLLIGILKLLSTFLILFSEAETYLSWHVYVPIGEACIHILMN